MNITTTYARAIFRLKIGGKFPTRLSWRLLTHLETLPEADHVYAFVVEDTLACLHGTRRADAKREAA